MSYIAALLTFASYCIAGSFVFWTGPFAIGAPFFAFCIASGAWLLWRVHRRSLREAHGG